MKPRAAVAEVVDAWTNPATADHHALQERTRRLWPELAGALDDLVDELEQARRGGPIITVHVDGPGGGIAGHLPPGPPPSAEAMLVRRAAGLRRRR